MSIRIPLSQINPQQTALIQKLLILKPHNEAAKWMNKRFSVPEPDPIRFYYADDTEVWLPRAFGKKMFPNHPESETILPCPMSFKSQLFEHQVPIYEECMKHLRETGGAILNIYTGAGKTIMASKMICEMGVLSLVLCHRNVLATQWQATFAEHSNITTWIVGDKVPSTPVSVIISLPGQLMHLPESMRQKIGFVAIDEAHCFCTQSVVPVLLGTVPRYILAMTATLERPDKLESMVYAICGLDRIIKISQKPFQVIKYLTGVEVETVQNRQGNLDWTDLVRKLSEHPRRNQLILDLVKNNPDKNILILCSLVDHAKYLTSELEKMGESVDFMAGNKDSYNNCRVLVGTVSKISCGFDQGSACLNFDGNRINLCILSFSTKQLTVLEQSVGRSFRSEHPVVYHLIDNHKTIKSHFSKCLTWYKSRNGTITEMKAPVETE